jgi:hypothetical protein
MPPVPTIRRDHAESRGSEDAIHGAPGDKPTLPYAKAFVVHFGFETDAGLKRATGRVEHLQSGRRATFASLVELLVCLVAMLGGEPAKPSRPTGRRSGGRRSTGARGGGAGRSRHDEGMRAARGGSPDRSSAAPDVIPASPTDQGAGADTAMVISRGRLT